MKKIIPITLSLFAFTALSSCGNANSSTSNSNGGNSSSSSSNSTTSSSGEKQVAINYMTPLEMKSPAVQQMFRSLMDIKQVKKQFLPHI